MATASSQPLANSANVATVPTIGAARSSSTGVPPQSESPNLLAPSPSLVSGVTNGAANGPSNTTVTTPDGPAGTDMRIYPRDGRVRNPVPSKLKNVNEHMKGNFGVMHMDVASHRASEGRDAAAKRTSESTALQAKMAQTDGYVSHQRRANYPRPPGIKQFTSPQKSVEPVPVPVPAPAPAPPAVPTPPPAPRQHKRSLTVAETKAEQARLLALLRSLPHHAVVDQICKGLAFFGGVPDAPPPADGKFPESAEANGPGSLFVGWIAEIFPDVDNPRKRVVGDVPPPTTATNKRPRGRPKGSKATKARSDKGLKKGSQKTGKGVENQAQEPHDESWVDVDESALDLQEHGDLLQVMDALRDGPSTPPPELVGGGGGGIPDATPATGSTGGFRSINDAALAPGSSAKKRGRPKGSKNRPKDKPAVITTAPPPKVTPVPVPVLMEAHPKNKTNPAKPNPGKNRPKQSADVATEVVTNNNQVPSQPPQQQQLADTNIPPSYSSGSRPSAAVPGFSDGFTSSGVNGAPGQSQDSSIPAQSIMPAPPPPASQVKASTVTAKKRKRPTATMAAHTESTVPLGEAAPPSTQNVQTNNTPIMGTSSQPPHQSSQAPTQPASNNNAAPPAKRSRKSQESSSAATARRQTPSSMAQKAPSQAITSLGEASQQPDAGSLVQGNPPAEGLEAHFAAMQSHTDQIQGYSSRPQHKHQPHSTSSMGSTMSPAPTAAPATTGGLDAHFDHFAALQSLPDNSRQSSAGRQQQQHQQLAQTVSPVPSHPTKLPQVPASLTPQQQSRAPQTQNYYSQGQGLASPYNSTSSYSTTQRTQQHISNPTPNTGLQHVTNSPQFSTQSNSPLMQADNNYRGSPSLMHNSAAFGTRRPPSASPLDNNTYRANSAASHGAPNHSPQFGPRQTSGGAAHNTSHSGLSSNFSAFSSDPGLFDMGLDSSGNHGSIGLGGGPYGLNSGGVPQQQQQRSSGSSTGPLYSSSGLNNSYLGPTNIGRTGQQNRWGA
ncbi:hypothetical protein GGS20DRAFT_168886 [Poronia punctata]|nr:hypothetical protein GGS20DRAFT_168886 [Poronia punctata]